MQPDAPDLLKSAVGKDPMSPSQTILRSRAVHVDLKRLAAAKPNDVLRVELFQDTVFRARFDRREDYGARQYLWHGRLDDREHSLFIISVDHASVFASFTHASHEHPYMIEIQGALGGHFVRELKQVHKNPPLAVPGPVRPPSGNTCSDDPNKIRIMCLYGRGAFAQAGCCHTLAAWIRGQVGYLNAVNGNSKTGIQYILTSIRDTGYTTQTNMIAELGRLRGRTDGYMDQIHAWRDAEKADLVALILKKDRGKHPRATGIAYAPGSRAQVNPTIGFSITEYSEPANVFTQEVSHNFGCHHEPANAPPTRIYPYSQAHSDYKDTGFPFYNSTAFTTVVGYPTFWRPIIPYYSSPNWTYQIKYTIGPDGPVLRMGTATLNDNRRSIINVKQLIANYRYSDRKFPVITRHPVSKTRCQGYQASAVMSVTATNAARYQWRKNGITLSGQTSSSLRFTNLTPGHAGSYDCIVTGACPSDSVISRRATLRVSDCRVFRYATNVDQVLAAVGDTNKDGYNDFASGYQVPISAGFRVFQGKNQTVTTWGRAGAEQLGASIAGGDIDGDGYSDVLAGSPGFNSNQGRVMWRSGRTGRVSVFTNGSTGSRLGEHLAVAHLDAAANVDVVVSAKEWLYGYSSRGNRRLWSVRPGVGVNIGSIATVGDINGDGYDEVIVGLPTDSSNSVQGGRLVLGIGQGRSAAAGVHRLCDRCALWRGRRGLGRRHRRRSGSGLCRELAVRILRPRLSELLVWSERQAHPQSRWKRRQPALRLLGVGHRRLQRRRDRRRSCRITRGKRPRFLPGAGRANGGDPAHPHGSDLGLRGRRRRTGYEW